MLQDNPILSSSEDAYARSEAAKRCADVLASIRSDAAYVVGLSGPWGGGKTSFVNMVKEALRTNNKETIVVSFNAWLYSSQEQLLKQFFSEVGKALGDNVGKKLGAVLAKEVGTALNEYADKITETTFSLAGAMFPQLIVLNAAAPNTVKLAKSFFTHNMQKAGAALKASDKTLEQMRADISKSLSKLDENIVVIIDDVDRLPQEDIRAIFKLVNLTASFPRMTYLLSYDDNVVRKALSDIQGTDGSDYLEKIVQVPIDLPRPPSDALRHQLEEVLVPYIESASFRFTYSERARLQQMFEPLVMRRIETPRQVKRYLNKFELMHAEVGGELCPVDVIGMASVLLFYPCVAGWLWEHRDEVCTTQRPVIDWDGSKAKALRESLSRSIAEDGAEENATIDALSSLFPKVGRLWSNVQGVSPKAERETGRVAHVSNLELVFETSDGLAIKRAELNHLTFVAGVEELVERMVQLDTQNELSRVVETIDVSRKELSGDRKTAICRALLKVFGRLKQDWGEGYLFRNPPEQVSWLLGTILLELGCEASDSLIEDATAEYGLNDFMGISWFLRDEGLRQTDEGKQSCLSSSCYSSLVQKYIDAIVDNYPKVLCLADHPAKFLWRYLDKALGEGAAGRMRTRYADDVAVRTLCAASTLVHWSSSVNTDGYGYDPSDKTGYEPVFQTPSMREIEEFGKTARFRPLPEVVRLRVASLYLLLRDGDFDQVTGERNVTSDQARMLLEAWQGSA